MWKGVFHVIKKQCTTMCLESSIWLIWKCVGQDILIAYQWKRISTNLKVKHTIENRLFRSVPLIRTSILLKDLSAVTTASTDAVNWNKIRHFIYIVLRVYSYSKALIRNWPNTNMTNSTPRENTVKNKIPEQSLYKSIVHWGNAQQNKRVFRAFFKPWTPWILLIAEGRVFLGERPT